MNLRFCGLEVALVKADRAWSWARSIVRLNFDKDDTLFGPAGADLDTAEVPGGLPRKPAYIGRTDLVFESGWRAALVQFYQHHIGGQRGAVGEYD